MKRICLKLNCTNWSCIPTLLTSVTNWLQMQVRWRRRTQLILANIHTGEMPPTLCPMCPQSRLWRTSFEDLQKRRTKLSLQRSQNQSHQNTTYPSSWGPRSPDWSPRTGPSPGLSVGISRCLFPSSAPSPSPVWALLPSPPPSRTWWRSPRKENIETEIAFEYFLWFSQYAE